MLQSQQQKNCGTGSGGKNAWEDPTGKQSASARLSGELLA